ncbi:copper transporter [Demequina sp.]|uniref:copper transporter n=1 Tax=Demequina sp. TaxID=2050685 RepID=UPI0025D004A3|nr:copper transporter [Demequina sp.]
MSDTRSRLLAAAAGLAVLAIGVVLGSGPLRAALLGDLGEQIDTLQTDLDGARAQTDAERARADAAVAYIDGAAPAILAGLLPGSAVVIVVAPGASDDAVAAIGARIGLAGGDLAGTVQLADGWTDPATRPFRSALADQVAPSLVGVDSTDPEEILAEAFVQGSTGAAPTGTDLAEIDAAGADRGAVLWDLLEQADLATGQPAARADAVIVVAGSDGDATAGLVNAFSRYDAPVTVAGAPAAVAPFAPGDAVATVAATGWTVGSVTVAATVAETVVGARPDYADGQVPGILGDSGVPSGADG